MYDFKKVENEAEKVWRKHKKEIKKAVLYDKKKPNFSFLEGPPTANAPPALHHLEVRTFKDLICKFKYMQGFSVPRKGGWDCHGLPVEVQIEKKLKLNSKKDIEKYGVKKFIDDARKSVFSYISDWEKSTEKLAYWIDLDNPYVTLDNKYIESVWWSLKELYNKKMLYESYKVVPFCPRCQTPLSSHEVSLGYKDVTEESVYIAFKLRGDTPSLNPEEDKLRQEADKKQVFSSSAKNVERKSLATSSKDRPSVVGLKHSQSKDKRNEYILAWTTTPWTLPGNVGLAVGNKIDYVKVQLEDGDKLILGKDKLNILHGKYKVLENLKGKDLVGLEYEPLYDIKETQNENSHKIIPADFVSTEEGTGVVHTAVMYGEDDYILGLKAGLPAVHTVGEDGKFLDIVPKFKGKFVKDAEKDIIQDLKDRHLLFKTEKITHSYPFCWRCDTPLLYYAITSWFVNVSKVRDKLVEANKKIKWEPSHIRDGRFGKWLENAKDWSLSRFKYWGTPLPIWRCVCGKEVVIGSIKELSDKSTKKIPKNMDLHKPLIDDVKLKCHCGKEMTRISDVIDCWYDSGSASFAQYHYPFENKDLFERHFPYSYISEAIDQTRGWFYTLHVLGILLFGKPAYKSVICAGHVVDEKGEKMSKSKGNIINPEEMMDQSGVDAIRLQFCTTDPGSQKRFSFSLMKESVIPFLTVLYNCNNYYNQLPKKKLNNQIEDKWILSRLNSTIENVTEDLEKYSIDDAFKVLMNFVVNDFSRNYIKITRDREDNKEIVGEILEKVSLLLAPFAPYISEYIYQNFSKNSVHLSKWPKADKKKIEKYLEKRFELITKIVESGLGERDKVQIGLKWPLAKATISYYVKLEKPFEEILKQQLNIKKIDWKKAHEKDWNVELDTNITPELEAEGYAREMSRQVQAFRKKLGLVKTDKIDLIIFTDGNFKKILESQEKFLKERTNSRKLEFVINGKENFKNKIEFKIKDKRGKIGIIH